MMQRRQFIQSSLASLILLKASPIKAAMQLTPDKLENKKIIWVMLRGAMDSLQSIVPVFDPDLLTHRASLVDPIKNDLLPLSGGYGMHPEYKNLHQWYLQKQLSSVVAVATGYRSRSHFDAQDQMESGLDITDHESGWLARALSAYHGEGYAITRALPIALRGNLHSQTWFPSNFAEAKEGLLERLSDLYQDDSELSEWLSKGVATQNSLSMSDKGSPKPNFSFLAKRCGELLQAQPDINCAMLELNGWDTHNAQVNRSKRQIRDLDKGLAVLKDSLGEVWQDTLVMVSTEFGRTVRVNGTNGTDHGTGSALFIAGGNINGGNILGEWPGLAANKLYQDRDLMPTSDIRSWMGAAIQQHWKLSDQQITSVFPDVKIQSTKIVS
jgi:uncharacterized protein (DUF1501 family)